MFVYAGIDEAGYGPLLGPLVVGRSVLCVPKLGEDASPPDLWRRLSKAVCRKLSGRRGRIAVNDSKKLTTPASGIKHLELGCLSFAGVAGLQAETVEGWLEWLGETCHRDLSHLPWYAQCEARPWEALPVVNSAGEIAVSRSMLGATCSRIGVEPRELGAAVVFEDRFNTMVTATRSKAAASFTFVSQHLMQIWQQYGEHSPFVAVDRQGGRTSYRELLSLAFEGVDLRVVDESAERSEYELRGDGRSMRVRFEVSAEEKHMPTALASMVSKYTRELLMRRLNGYFASYAPQVRPTAGYATDGKRYVQELRPVLTKLGIDERTMCRQA